MNQMIRYWPLALTLALLACQQPEVGELKAINENLRNSNKVTLLKNTIPGTERVANVPMNPAYFIIMEDGVNPDSSKKLLAYGVNCEEDNADEVLQAFGLSKTSAITQSLSVATLNRRFEVEKQPVFDCSAVRAQAEKQQVSAVFSLQSDPADAGQKNPSYYVKFRKFPEQLFQVGCLNILNSFAQEPNQERNFAKDAIPLADAHVLHYLDRNVEQTPPTEAVNANSIRRLFCRQSDATKVLPNPQRLATKPQFNDPPSVAKLLHVTTGNESYYVYSWATGSRVLECPGTPESEMLKALNFSPDQSAIAALPSDEAVIAANMTDKLRCINPLFDPLFTVGFRTVDEKPARRAYKSTRESPELVTFGCDSAEQFFIGDSLSPEAMIAVSQKSLDYLLSQANLSKPKSTVERVHIPCAEISQKHRQWLASLEKIGPLGGSGGGPFELGCPEGAHVVKAQVQTGITFGRDGVLDVRIACSDGFNNLKGDENIFSIDRDVLLTAYAHQWLSGITLGTKHVGSVDGYQGELRCDEDSRLAGFFGNKGAAVDSIGLLCFSEISKVGPLGAADSTDKFDLKCERDQHVAELLVSIGDVVGHTSLTNIGIKCSDGVQKSAMPLTANIQRFPPSRANAAIKIFHGSWINGIEIDGNFGGVTAGLVKKELNCPIGKNLVGIFGSSGMAINNLGVKCR